MTMLDKTFSFLTLLPDFADKERADDTDMFREALNEVRSLRGLPEIVLLAGSARFQQAFSDVAYRFALDGRIVLGKHVFKPGTDWPLSEHEKDLIHAIQFRMCELANRLHVVNVDGYIGQDTYNLIKHAMKLNLVLTFHEQRVKLLQGSEVTAHHFVQATRRTVEFELAAL